MTLKGGALLAYVFAPFDSAAVSAHKFLRIVHLRPVVFNLE